MKVPTPSSRPEAWKYFLAAALLLFILIPAWTLFVMLVIQPESLMENPSVGKQLAWWVGVPVVAVAALVSWRWQGANDETSRLERTAAAAARVQPHTAPRSEQARREYVLEVIGLGLTLDKYRQGAVWDAIKAGDPYASVREQDPKKYPWSASEKDGVDGSRVNDALESGAKAAPIYWGQPAFYAGAVEDPKQPLSPINCPTVIGDPEINGMSGNLFVAADWETAERPDRLLERVFAFFDEHPDVPYVVVSSDDSPYFRDLYRPKGSPPMRGDGHYIPEMPDSAALLLLARRERVDALRPFVFKDADADNNMLAPEANVKGFARRLYLTYLHLQQTNPKPEGDLKRDPTVPEWLDATRRFAQRDDIYPKGISKLADDLNPLANGRHPSRDFKPTPWFPIPWGTYQIEAFDNLPTLGFLHRPVFVRTVDAEGRPLARRDARAAALAAGWQDALQTLPEADRKAAPARVVVSAGKSGKATTEQTIALTTVLADWAAQGGPELDKTDPTRWIDTEARLGNTGAATWLVQMAIGVMGSFKDGGTSAAINLRDPREASIVLVTPPTEAQRQGSNAVRAERMFRFQATPAIDPKNYEQK